MYIAGGVGVVALIGGIIAVASSGSKSKKKAPAASERRGKSRR
jgi:hypothetical protein